MEIRRFRPEDADTVWRLHVDALEHADAHGPGPWDDDLRDVQRNYLDAGGEFVVGEVDGRIVAMGALRRIDDREAEVKRMRVAPELQRRGFGREILVHLETRALALGFGVLRLDTITQQAAAQAFYRAHGYAEYARQQRGRWELVLFQKEIAPQDGV